jgi:hypothetical protein
VSGPALVLYDDATARAFAPFALTRPFCAVRAGAELIGRRWRRALGSSTSSFASSPHLAGFAESGGETAAAGSLAAGTIVANSRYVVALGALNDSARNANVWRGGEHIAAVRLAKPLAIESLADGSLTIESLAANTGTTARIPGRWIHAVWDLIGQLPDQLAEDATALAATVSDASPVRAERTGANPVGARVEAFSRIVGPCVIGPASQILGGRVSGSAIGDDCRVHGDLSTSILIGHANKAHEGFVGHSVIGRWANLGAGTTTSNLKNSYGSVKLWTPGGEHETGLTFLGSLIGDHAKLGIGTMLGTGTVVGAGANVFGTLRPPKRVPPFAWGDAPPYETFSLEKFLEVAARVMARRNVTLDDALATLSGMW